MFDGRRVDALERYLQRTRQPVDVAHRKLDEFARETLRSQPNPDTFVGVAALYAVAALSTAIGYGLLVYAQNTKVVRWTPPEVGGWILIVWALVCAGLGTVLLGSRLRYKLEVKNGTARILDVGFFVRSGSGSDPADVYVARVEVTGSGASGLQDKLFLARRSAKEWFGVGTELPVRYIPGQSGTLRLARDAAFAVGHIAEPNRWPVQRARTRDFEDFDDHDVHHFDDD